MHLVQKNVNPRDLIAGIATAGAMALLDLATKRTWFPADEASSAFAFLDGWIRNVRHENHGLIANLPVPQPVILLVSFTVITVALYGCWRASRERNRSVALALAVLLGGAFGNLYDRLVFGYVRDWILIGGISALNLADLAIFLGMAGWLLFQRRNIHT